jgi:hypothetical protein
MPRLTPKVLEFVAVYCADPHRNGAAAYRQTHSANAAPLVAANGAYRILSRGDVQAIVRRYDERLSENLVLSAADVTRIWTENVVTDRNDLVEVRRVCCRFCHSPNGDAQFTIGEQRGRLRDHELKVRLMLARMPATAQAAPLIIESMKAAMRFEELGGDGLNRRLPINTACVECDGLGEERVIIKDTRTLSPAARAIYEGAKVTKDGIEIKMASRADTLAALAKAYGIGGDKPPPRPGDGAQNVTPKDPIEAGRYYARLMDQSDDD